MKREIDLTPYIPAIMEAAEKTSKQLAKLGILSPETVGEISRFLDDLEGKR